MQPPWLTNGALSVLFNERFQVVPYDPSIQAERIPWIIDTLWMAGRINAIFGPEKSGKSRLIAWLLASLLTKRPTAVGVSCHAHNAPKRWLYLAGEETPDIVIQRIRDYAVLMGADANAEYPIDFAVVPGMRMETAPERDRLEQYMLGGGYDALVIEPLRRVHGGDEDSNSEMAPIHNTLRKWSNEHGITTVLCHHTGKLSDFADMNRIASWSRGCSDLATVVDTAAFVAEQSRGKGSRTMKLLRAGRFPPVDPATLIDSGDPDAGGRGFFRGV